MYPQKAETFLQKIIGTPYIKSDCWQIVKSFYHSVLDIEIGITTDYQNPNDRETISRVVEINKCNFKEVDEPKFGDILLLRLYGQPVHVGVYLGADKFLHTFEATGCVIASISLWKRKIEGFYRWPK